MLWGKTKQSEGQRDMGMVLGKRGCSYEEVRKLKNCGRGPVDEQGQISLNTGNSKYKCVEAGACLGDRSSCEAPCHRKLMGQSRRGEVRQASRFSGASWVSLRAEYIGGAVKSGQLRSNYQLLCVHC